MPKQDLPSASLVEQLPPTLTVNIQKLVLVPKAGTVAEVSAIAHALQEKLGVPVQFIVNDKLYTVELITREVGYGSVFEKKTKCHLPHHV